jgi:hypothetical protein
MEGGCTCRQVRYRLIGTPLIVMLAIAVGASQRAIFWPLPLAEGVTTISVSAASG